MMASSPGYEAKFMTGPVDTSEQMLRRAESDRLFGGETSPEQRDGIDAIGTDMRERLQDVARESSETIANLPPEIQDKVLEEIGGERDVFVKLVPNSADTADLVIFVDSLGEELARDSILVERP